MGYLLSTRGTDCYNALMDHELARINASSELDTIFNSNGYESGFDFDHLPLFIDLADIDSRLTTIIPELLKKIASDDNRETGYMAKLNNGEVILSDITTGADDAKQIRFDVDEFLKPYRIDGERKREKLLYDINTHEIVDIGPSPRDLTNLFKEVDIYGGHFSIIVSASKIYLLVRTQQSPSLSIATAVKHVDTISRWLSETFQRFHRCST